MISFKTISSFRSRLSDLLKVRRKVYANVEEEIKREFTGKPIEQIRQNPKNGPLQQLDIADNELKFLMKQFINEAQMNLLESYAM